jgi:acyl-CoA synthetase (AMP-forming)/AMP-acid ligase II
MTAPVNVSAHLAAMAAADPHRPAVRYPHGRGRTALTFAELHAESDAVAHGLAAIGVGRGTRVALMVPPSLEFFSLTFALLKAAAVPVLIDPGMGVANLGRCLADAEPEAFVGVRRAHIARRLFGWGRGTVRASVSVGRGRFFCTRSYGGLVESGRPLGPFNPPAVTADDPAAVLFTSGSTGVAKGAEYTHGIFAAQVEMLRAEYGIRPGEVDLCTFPLFALFGPALGMSCVIPDMDASRPATIDPRKAAGYVRRFGVTNLFGSPAVIRRLGDHGEPLPTLRRAISAGAPASAPTVERFAKLLPPGVQLFTPYGATEALPVANVGSDEILAETRHLTDIGRGVCVGRPFAGVSVSVIRITDEPVPTWDESLRVPPGEVGEIVVRGPVVTKRYFRRDEATRLAKMRDPATGEVLHRMGDVGYFDDRGRLWFCGRKSHRVETPAGTLFTDMVEPVFNAVDPGLIRTALVGVRRGGVAHPVVCFERPGLTDPHPKTVEPHAARLREQAERFPHTRAITTFLYHHFPFPVDVRHNSKIFREKLAVWADRVLGKDWHPGVAHGRPAVSVGGRR